MPRSGGVSVVHTSVALRPYFWVFEDSTKKPLEGIVLYWESLDETSKEGCCAGVSGVDGMVHPLIRGEEGCPCGEEESTLLVGGSMPLFGSDKKFARSCRLEYPDGKTLHAIRTGIFWEFRNVVCATMLGKTIRVWLG